jgi:hypothetical protein
MTDSYGPTTRAGMWPSMAPTGRMRNLEQISEPEVLPGCNLMEQS